MSDVKTLHHLWLVVEQGRRVSQDHAKVGGFEKALREKRTAAGEFVVSTAVIRLPFRVETEIAHEPLHWSASNTYVLYVDLRPARDMYLGAAGYEALNHMSSAAKGDGEQAGNTVQKISRDTAGVHTPSVE